MPPTSSLLAFGLAQDHPTLPTMWVSTTNEPGVGVGVEAYYFVDQPTQAEPSALWSNYSGCERLIIDDGTFEYTKRYLLGCDALDCCYEMQDGNQVEFQIPNTHPKPATVTYGGSVAIDDHKFSPGIKADSWSWQTSTGVEKWTAYTNACPDCVNNVTVVRWHVQALTAIANIDFDSDFKGIPEANRESFKQMFQVPKVCQPVNLLPCPSTSDGESSVPLSPMEQLFLRR